MPVLQFKCDSCNSVFEYLLSANVNFSLDCISCGGDKVSRLGSSYFYPNKTFCPHDKEIKVEELKTSLGVIMSDASQKCGGCGTDGAPGKCGKSQGGCGSGKCGTCSCGKNR